MFKQYQTLDRTRRGLLLSAAHRVLSRQLQRLLFGANCRQRVLTRHHRTLVWSDGRPRQCCIVVNLIKPALPPACPAKRPISLCIYCAKIFYSIYLHPYLALQAVVVTLLDIHIRFGKLDSDFSKTTYERLAAFIFNSQPRWYVPECA